jgi:3-oxoacyl-[acyl-carrier protein] reductase
MPEYRPDRLFDLTDRVIIVTGGGKGLGGVYSGHLSSLGAKIGVADIDARAAEATTQAISERQGQALCLPTDVSDAASVERMASAVIERWGRIDGLVNNAALMSVLPRQEDRFQIEEAEWDKVFEVNLKGMFLCCRAVFPVMREQGSGKIVNISSGRIFEGTPFRLHYTTSKAGVVGLTRALAREVGSHNICVNALSPGLTLSDTQIATSSQAYISTHEEGRAFKRVQVPEDLLGPLTFLLAPASNFMTGQTINVDGGRSMH